MYWRLIRYTCVAFLGLWLLNALANMFYWYLSIRWFDIMMHTFGGVAVALAVSALLVRTYATYQKILIPVLLSVFIVGLAWEYYEYALQHVIRGAELANIPDSISDLVADMVGGLIGSYLAIRTQRRYNK